MNMQSAIKTLIEQKDIAKDDMIDVMKLIMTGQATDAQMGAFLVALRLKGESVDEIVAAAQVMRDLSSKVQLKNTKHMVDTCGTGGDGANTFNISTVSAIVVAAAGGIVAKHGNRSVSSQCGSADLLEIAGVNLDLTPEQVGTCIDEIGIGFMFAPKHHSAMKHAIGPRKELAIRTIFNVLGPLTNPANSPNQVLGVFDKSLVEPLANVLKKLGSQHVLVVHSDDGLDEFSINSETYVAELKEGEISTYHVSAEQFGLSKASLSELKAENAKQSLDIIKSVLNGEKNAARDIVLLNAGAAIYAADLADSIQQGIEKAAAVIDNGDALNKLNQLVTTTSSL
ncbi:MAG: anthranilate phosphoribosyltransferase [Methylococcales bacterium]|nr:anthranilate phosphoribosyltransferase [Methylococcales bacterium]MBT7409757.1 anthranilate phosphoribosyltransferase [Methylococcales bacterium]